MNTTSSLLLLLLFLLLLFLSSTPTKAQKRHLETSCPEAEDIDPCVCRNAPSLTMTCSRARDEEELRGVFSAHYPSRAFYRFEMLGNDGVQVLEDGVFHGVSFEVLDIEKSALETVRNHALEASYQTAAAITITSSGLAVFPFSTLPEFTSLRTLSLRSNQLHSLSSLQSSSLRSLDLSLNPISYLSSDVFKDLPNVEELHLNGTHLSQISPGTFSVLPRLSNLVLSGNKISSLSSLSFSLVTSPSSPGHLDLQNNYINTVEVDAFKGVQGPSTINLDNNSLTNLKEEVWRPVLEGDVTLTLEGNSLSCGCDVAWLVRNPHLLALTSAARCADGTLLADFDPSDFDYCG